MAGGTAEPDTVAVNVTESPTFGVAPEDRRLTEVSDLLTTWPPDKLALFAVKFESPRYSTVIVCVPAVSEVVASLSTQALFTLHVPPETSVLVTPIGVPVVAGPSQNFTWPVGG